MEGRCGTLGGRARATLKTLIGAALICLVSPAAASALPATHFSVGAPANATTGVPFQFSVVARDALNNIDATYLGTVHFTSSDGAAALPANSTLTMGVGTFNATLNTVGSRTITATDTAIAAITGTSSPITVAVPRLTFTVPRSAMVGSPFDFTVAATDSNGAVDTAYTGTVHFTSSDGAAVLPADSTLTMGVKTFSATLQTEGIMTLTGTDTGTAASPGTSSGIGVRTATHFAVTAPSSATPGSAFGFTVKALNADGSVDSGYPGSVRFTSSDGDATLPLDSTLTNGTGTFNATLRTPGSATISVTDSGDPSLSGKSGPIAVGGSNGQSGFRIRKLKRNLRNGTATLILDVPGPGKLTLGGKGVSPQRTPRAAGRHSLARAISGAGTVKLTIKSRGAARRKLRATGKVTVTTKIVFTPQGDAPQRRSKRVKLLLRP
jgi:hypothetical protein